MQAQLESPSTNEQIRSFPFSRIKFRLSFDPARHVRRSPKREAGKVLETMELRVSEYQHECDNLRETIKRIENSNGLTASILSERNEELLILKERLDAATEFLENFRGKAAFWRDFVYDPEAVKGVLFKELLRSNNLQR